MQKVDMTGNNRINKNKQEQTVCFLCFHAMHLVGFLLFLVFT